MEPAPCSLGQLPTRRSSGNYQGCDRLTEEKGAVSIRPAAESMTDTLTKLPCLSALPLKADIGSSDIDVC